MNAGQKMTAPTKGAIRAERDAALELLDQARDRLVRIARRYRIACAATFALGLLAGSFL